MQTYELVVRNRSVLPNSKDMTLVRTSIGIDQVRVLFADEEWMGFPVMITFANGESVVTEPIVLSAVVDSNEFVAESYVTIPFEVIRDLGQIRVTLQGTDANGRHIITAKGEPLSVEESGDVEEGDEPGEAPTPSDWRQAYAEAMAVVNQAASVISTLQVQLDSMVADARSSLDDAIASALVPATRESLGTVLVGNGLDVTESGEIYVSAVPGITQSERAQIANLAALAYYCFDTEFDEDGNLLGSARVKPSALPIATLTEAGAVIPDGLTIRIDQGVISGAQE